jgi:Protein of unknown function (DUF4235)
MAKRSKNQEEPVEAAAKPAKEPGAVGYKVLTTVGATLGATVARKVLTTGWTKTTGKEPPANPEHPNVRLTEAATWAAASAAVVAVARLLAQRRVAASWQRASGELPPGLGTPAE